jgi:hypothetical protein
MTWGFLSSFSSSQDASRLEWHAHYQHVSHPSHLNETSSRNGGSYTATAVTCQYLRLQQESLASTLQFAEFEAFQSQIMDVTTRNNFTHVQDDGWYRHIYIYILKMHMHLYLFNYYIDSI